MSGWKAVIETELEMTEKKMEPEGKDFKQLL